ncbi:MAG: hypothetical protein FWC47_15585 [Oscillospiraceae bacterium]|nr:hypothetical protein [Oscillospiraceae bacterium]
MYMTMEEIKKKYSGQWVFMINCKRGEYHDTIGGEVVVHSERRDKVIGEMSKFNDGKSKTFIGFVGEIPEGISVIL